MKLNPCRAGGRRPGGGVKMLPFYNGAQVITNALTVGGTIDDSPATGAGLVPGGGTSVVVADKIHGDTLSGVLAYGSTNEVSARLIRLNSSRVVKLFFLADPLFQPIQGTNAFYTNFAN